MDGFAFCRRLKENPAWSYIPFVLLTREQSDRRRFAGLELGIMHYLQKPIFVQDLLLRVRALAAKAREDRPLLGELWRARGLHEGLVGPREPVQHGPLTLAGYFAPAGVCGGDFWNTFELGPQAALVLVADVTGHGVPSALIAAAIRACCDTIGLVAPARPSVSTVMTTLNRVCCRVAQQKLHVTCFVSLFDFQRSTMTYASAGHPPPFIFRPATPPNRPRPSPWPRAPRASCWERTPRRAFRRARSRCEAAMSSSGTPTVWSSRETAPGSPGERAACSAPCAPPGASGARPISFARRCCGRRWSTTTACLPRTTSRW